MASGIEARVPFLDQDLVGLMVACPPHLKAAQQGKAIVNDIARDLLPAEIVDRPKGYFPVPATTQLDGPVLDLVRDTLRSATATSRGLLRCDFVTMLLEAPNANMTRVGGNALWDIAVLAMWFQKHHIT
jgi:asparagine synthase (glutamine-hydrolysing)